ncbi:MAG: LytTR family DNA-binding domain-containing protein [Cyclobacteriaceae bacterium]
MKVIIIEDEILAQSKLEAMLQAIDPAIEVVAKLGSVEESKEYLALNPAPDVAFVDIQLSDDHSFEIFRNYPLQFPVIFTTAFDKYLLESFEHNAIDYLLKPITEEKLKRSLAKLRKLELHFIQGNMQKLIQANARVKDRIVAKKGTEFIALRWNEIAYFFTEHKVVFVKDQQGRQYIIDKNLGELEADLDEKIFFRLNRKFLTHVSAIEKFKPDNGKIRVFLKPPVQEEVHVSKETAPEFRKWIGAE